jgi:hypothetical protein
VEGAVRAALVPRGARSIACGRASLFARARAANKRRRRAQERKSWKDEYRSLSSAGLPLVADHGRYVRLPQARKRCAASAAELARARALSRGSLLLQSDALAPFSKHCRCVDRDAGVELCWTEVRRVRARRRRRFGLFRW